MKKIVKLNANTDTLTNWQSDVILHVIKIERTICKHNHFSCVDCVEISRLMNLLQHFVHLLRWQIIEYLFLSQMLLVNSIEINFNLSKFFIHNQSKWRYNSLKLVVYSLSLGFFLSFSLPNTLTAVVSTQTNDMTLLCWRDGVRESHFAYMYKPISFV